MLSEVSKLDVKGKNYFGLRSSQLKYRGRNGFWNCRRNLLSRFHLFWKTRVNTPNLLSFRQEKAIYTVVDFLCTTLLL